MVAAVDSEATVVVAAADAAADVEVSLLDIALRSSSERSLRKYLNDLFVVWVVEKGFLLLSHFLVACGIVQCVCEYLVIGET